MTQAAYNALPEQLVALVNEQLGGEAQARQLTPDLTFESLGMDSLALMELVVAAEERFGIVPSEEAMDLAPSATLAAAARAFADAR
ncbi:acyl carrier protein [Streptomyces sp. CB00455]|uniref:phosphopantetheine-binding protein n=1 Tax=Streptomyces sp. CB00455 TaxID=1703927 RepID=UPI00095F30A8|nr:phosphopantetheine-binding protein [Streptomyces sp. CB00455]OKK15674.1 acyl carrier protein [Streptomyces sp. CB00455]